MNSEWGSVAISSICEGIFDGPHATPKKTTSGPIFLGISALESGRLNLDKTEHLSEGDFQRWTKRISPREGDIVFSYETRLGDVAMIPAGLRCCLGRRMALMRVDRSKAVPEYVLYAFMSPAFQDVIRARTIHGSTVDRIPLSEFGDFCLPMPPPHIQRSIATTLKSIDDRIAVLRQTNTTLEAIAQALFKSWFVDFDPVRAKMEGRAPDGMDESIAALFPNTLEESSMGLVPKGWGISTLGALTSTHGGTIQTGPFGSQLHASDYSDQGIPVAMPKDIINRRINPASVARVSDEHVSRLARHKLVSGDIVFSRRGDVERHALVTAYEAGWLCGTGCLLIRPGPGWRWPAYLSMLLDASYAKAWLVQHAVGATMPNLNTGILGSIPVVTAPAEILDRYEQIAMAVEVKRSESIAMLQTLSALRDTLLPRLISGQLRLKEEEVSTEDPKVNC